MPEITPDNPPSRDSSGAPQPGEFLRPRMLYEALADAIRERIFSHQLVPGEAIDELRLASSYGVSRTPLREALKVLATEGLVELRARQGCFVTRLMRHDLEQIFDILDWLEGFAVHQASLAGAALEPRADFYPALLAASGNHYLPDLVGRLTDKLRLAFGPFFESPAIQPSDAMQAALRQHIAERDTEAALAVIGDYARQRRSSGLAIFLASADA